MWRYIRANLAIGNSEVTPENRYSEYPKISYTKVYNKMANANSVDPDQTAPEGAVWSGSTLFAIPLGILRNNCIKPIFKQKKK